MDYNSDDEIFDFKNENHIETEYNTSLSNDQHYKVMKEISSNFFDKLSTSNYYDIFHNWSSYSIEEPITINMEPIEINAGVFDLIKSDNIFLNKIISVYSILGGELYNILSNNDYECLYPLIVYGESSDDVEQIEDGESESQIARMLPLFMEILEKVTKLLSIAINIINQTIA